MVEAASGVMSAAACLVVLGGCFGVCVEACGSGEADCFHDHCFEFFDLSFRHFSSPWAIRDGSKFLSRMRSLLKSSQMSGRLMIVKSVGYLRAPAILGG